MARTILIVEDDELFVRALRRSLASAPEPPRVLVVGSAEAAVEALDGQAIDLVLLDVCLGSGGSGVAVADYAWRRTPAPAIIAMSGEATRADVFTLAQLGVHAYFEKTELPRTLEELLAVASHPPPIEPHVKRLVGRRSLGDVVGRVRECMRDQALAMSEGNVSRASRELGVTRRAIQKAQRRRSSS
ncbi:MAG: response regulator [Sandaracinaceae bacterium]|nr:response regulator [Sandaracinaceae bacterium]